MSDNHKKHTKKVKYPVQPMMIPAGAQPMIYPQPIMGQPQPVYAMQPQPMAMPMVQ